MSMMNTPASPRWRVINVSPGTGQDQTGRYVQGNTVTYQLQTGQTGTVFVPQGQEAKDYVKAVVTEAAANLADLHNLTSES